MVSSEEDVVEQLREQGRKISHSSRTDAENIVNIYEEAWEETGHWGIFYGSSIGESLDFRDDNDLDEYLDRKSEWWEGFYYGLANRGIDIYQLAERVRLEAWMRLKGKD